MVKADGWMKNMLHTVNDHGAIRLIIKTDNAFHAQQMRPMSFAQQIQEEIKAAFRHELVALQTKSANARIVPVHIMRVLRIVIMLVVVMIMVVMMVMMMVVAMVMKGF